jgi:cytochrome c5
MKAITASTFSALLIAAALAACGDKAPAGAEASASARAQEAAPAPAAAHAAPAAAAPAVPAASAADLAKGEKIYTATCLACHGAGVLGAPKFADPAAWQPRIAKGIETLYGSAINGFNMMPPRGGNAVLKDDEMKAAVDYMVSKAH